MTAPVECERAMIDTIVAGDCDPAPFRHVSDANFRKVSAT